MNNNEILKRIIENEIAITNDPHEAIYCLRDGTLIDGEFHQGARCIDHRNFAENMIDAYDRYSPNNLLWKTLQKECEVVMLVPETCEALIGSNQTLTECQKGILKTLNYNLSVYC